MKLKDVLNIIDDETRVKIDLPESDGGDSIVMWAADWIGGDEEIIARVTPFLDRETYDIYADTFIDQADYAPRIVIPVAPEGPMKRYRLRYRGCAKGDTPPTKEEDPKVGEIVEWTVAEILEEINRDRSGHWTDYDETDWKEGLDEWTWYELVGEAT